MKKYTILNTGRISDQVKIILEGSYDSVFSALLKDDNYEFKKKDVAQIFKITPSSLSKQISKINKTE
jgi:hypothetical protein